MTKVLAYAAIILVSLMLIVGGFFLTRWVHFEMSYRYQVEDMIRTMVKPEALK